MHTFDRHAFTDKFRSTQNGIDFLKVTMMGPNAMRISEEMASYLDIQNDMCVLDLGCGCGLSSLLLVQKYGVRVFAADLWISPTENYERFKALGIEDKAIPISVDAAKGLPFANAYFDILFSVDAYHYFGRTTEMLPSLIPYVKKGGYIAVAIPGWQKEPEGGIPQELKPFFSEADAETFHSTVWWKNLWSKTDGIETIDAQEMACCKQSWEEWLTSPNPYATADRGIMEAENGKYFSIIQLIAKTSK
ncbi:MAG: methyltransferase domain-containing protein [Nitrososphaerota archaeon]|jgi:cyclopropane fatty-acyl-phospholipid synthase-like methyltransferase|nr:methyltransferase domain-containing protein [Nitrososphaerota archaeon]